MGDLSALKSIGGYLYIFRNGALETMGDLSALTSIGGYLYIGFNGALETIGDLSALKSIGEYLFIGFNGALETIGDFSALTSIGGYLQISENEALETMDDLSALTSIGGYLQIDNNGALETMGDLSALTSIGEYLYILNNGALETMGDFSALTSIGKHLHIQSNNNLTDLGDLSALTSIGTGNAYVLSENTTINGVSIVIAANPNLFSCCDLADLLPAQARAVSGVIFTRGNSASCNLPSTGTDAQKAAVFSGICERLAFTTQSEIDAFDFAASAAKYIVIGPSSGADAITNISKLSTLSALISLDIIENQKLQFIDHPMDNTKNGLENLTTITGDLTIYNNPLLENLDGFPLLTKVGGNVSAQDNSKLQNVDGISALTRIGENLSIGRNDALKTISDFPALKSIGKWLYIESNAVLETFGDFPALKSIGGEIYIGYNVVLETMGNFPALTSIGDDLIISRDDKLQYLGDFSALKSIGGGLDISNNVALKTIDDFPALKSIRRGFYIFKNNALETINNFPTLETIGGDVTISRNDILETINHFSTLKSIGGDASIEYNNALETIGNFPALESIGEYISIEYNDALETIGDFPALTSIGEYLRIFNDDALETIGDFPALTSIGEDLFISVNAELQSLGDFPTLASVGGNFLIGGSRELAIIGDFPALTSIGGYLYIGGNEKLQSLGNFSALTSIGKSTAYVPSESSSIDDVSIIIEGNTNLFACCDLADFLPAQVNTLSGRIFINNNSASCNLPSTGTDDEKAAALKAVCETTTFTRQSQIDAFDFAASAAKNIVIGPSSGDDAITNISALNTITLLLSLIIQDNQELQFIDHPMDDTKNGLENLATIINGLIISNNPSLTNLNGFPLLTKVGDSITVQNNEKLQSLGDFSALKSIGGDLYIWNNDALETIGEFPVLTSIGRHLSIGSNVALETIGDFSALKSIGSTLYIWRNGALETIGDFSALTSVGRNLEIIENDNLETMGDFSALTSVGRNLSIVLNATLETMSDFSALKSIGGYLSIWRNGALETMDDFSALKSIGGYLDIFNNGALETMDSFSALKSIGGDLNINNNGALETMDSFSALKSIGGWLSIFRNDALETMGDLSALESIGGSFPFVNNGALETMGDFPALTSIGGWLNIGGNDALETMGDFPVLTSIGGWLRVYNNVALETMGDLSALKSIGGNLEIIENDNLETMGDFPALKSIGGYLYIFNNGALETIGDLSALTSIGKHLHIQSNNNLTDLGNLSALTSIGKGNAYVFSENTAINDVSIVVESNPNLAVCCDLADFLPAQAHAVSGSIYIGINSAGCNLPSTGTNDAKAAALRAACGTTTFTTQSQINAFDFANIVARNIVIGPSSGVDAITNISRLSEITPLLSLTITSNQELQNLNGLSALTRISGNLSVINNAKLQSLSDLSALKSIGSYLNIFYNGALETIGDLSALTSIGSYVYIGENTELQSLGDFSALETIGGSLSSVNNSKLQSLGDLSSLTSIGSYLNVRGNANLQSLGDLSALESIGTSDDIPVPSEDANIDNVSIIVEANPKLFACCNLVDFLPAQAQAVSGGIYINNNSASCNLATTGTDAEKAAAFVVDCRITFTLQSQINTFDFSTATDRNIIIGPSSGSDAITNLSALSEIPSLLSLTITENTELQNLNGLSNLTRISGSLEVRNNAKLQSLGDLSALETIGGYLFIQNNAKLQSLDDLSALTSIGSDRVSVPSESANIDNVSIVVEDNDTLSDCYALTAFLTGGTHAVSGGIYINNNAGVCTNQSALDNTIYRGDITVTTQAAVDALRTTLAGKTRIDGNLTIGYASGNSLSDITDLTPLSNIVRITENARIQQNGQLINLNGLTHLQAIGGHFSVGKNDTLTTLDFPALQTIGDFFSVWNNTNISTLGDFPALQSIGGFFQVLSNEKLITLGDFPTLQSIGGFFIVRNNSELTDLGDFPVLQSIGGYFWVDSNSELTELGDFPVLQTIGGFFSVGNNSKLTELGDFPVLQTIGGFFSVGNNSKLTDLGDFPVLQTIGGFFSVGNNSKLTELGDFPVLQTIGGFFSVGNNSKLTELGDFPVLKSIGEYFSVSGNGELTDLGDFHVLQTIGGYFYVSNNDVLTTLGNFPSLTSIGVGPTTVPSLAQYKGNVSIVVEDNSRLYDCYVLIDFIPGGAHAVSGEIYINNNAGVCANQSALDNTIYRGDITVTTQEQANALYNTLRSKTIIFGNVTIGYTDGSSTRSNIIFYLSSIVHITGNLIIQQNRPLVSLNGFNNLRSIGGVFYVGYNDRLTTLDFPALQTVGMNFSVNNNGELTELGNFSALQSIGGGFTVNNNAQLTTLGNVEKLQSIGGGFTVNNNDKLTTLGNFSALTSIGVGSTTVPSLGELTENVSIVIENNPSLSDCYTLTELFSGGTRAVNGQVFINNNNNVSACINKTGLLNTIHQGNITVTTQAQVDTLRTTLAGKTRIDGNLTIGYADEISRSDITDLSSLSNIVRISGNIRIQQNGQLANLNDLTHLRSIGGGFWVLNNDKLTTLKNFLDLQSIGGSLWVKGNDTLTSLGDYFPDLQSIGGGFNVSSNGGLIDLGDFPDLQTIGGGFHVSSNGGLIDLGDFPALQTIGGGFYITNNDTLTGLGNFSALTSIGIGVKNVSIRVEDNPILSDCFVLTEFLSGGNYIVSGEIYVNNNAGVCGNQNALSNTIYHGDITVTTQAAVNALSTSLAGKTIIDGNLTIGYTSGSSLSNITDLAPLNNITRITGDVLIQQNGQLTNLNALTHLQSIGGYFRVFYHTSLTTLEDFPVLQSIGGDFILKTPNMPNFPVLQSIGGYFYLERSSQLITPENFPVLQSIGGGFHVQSNSQLTTLDFPALQSIGGYFYVVDNDTLTTLDFPALQSIGEYFRVDYNAKLTTLDNFPALQSIGEYFRVDYNDKLTTFGNFPALQSIGGGFRVDYNAKLTTFGNFPALQSIGKGSYDKNFHVQGNSQLTTFGNFPALQSIGGYFGEGGNSLTTLGNFSALQTIRGFFTVNSSLTTLGNFSALQTIRGYFTVSSDSLLDFPALQSIGGDFRVSSSLTTLGNFPALQSIGGDFDVDNKAGLTTLDFPALQSIGGDFDVDNNAGLTTLGNFPVLQSIGRYFNVVDNDTLTSLGNFPVLTSIGVGSIYIPSLGQSKGNVSIRVENNSSLSDCHTLTKFLPGGAHAVSGDIHISNNAGVCNSQNDLLNIIYRGDITVTRQSDVNDLSTSLAGKTIIDGNVTIGYTSGSSRSTITRLTPLGNIVGITGNLIIQQNRQLVNLNGLHNLQSIGQQFTMNFNDQLTTVGDFSVLQSIGGGFEMSANSQLTTSGDFSVLQSIGEGFEVRDNNQLPALGNFSALQFIGGDFSVSANNQLTELGNLSKLQTIGGGFSVSNSEELIELGNFSALQSIGGFFSVSSNDTLTTLGNFPALQSIEGGVNVENNNILTTLGNFPILESIGGNLYIYDNVQITGLGDFSTLQTVEGNFYVGFNGQLTTLGGFSALQTIEGEFNVENNPTLTTLGEYFPVLQTIRGDFRVNKSGQLITLGYFSDLESIGGYFSVSSNDTLTFLGSFPNLTSIGIGEAYVPSSGDNRKNVSIVVEQNPLLAYCCVLTNFRTGGTDQVPGTVHITNNASGCSSDSEANCSPFINLSDGDTLMLPFISSNFDFTISSNERWRLGMPLESESDWITLSVRDSAVSNDVGFIGGADNTLTHTPVRVHHSKHELYTFRIVNFPIFLIDENETSPDTLTIIQEENQIPRIVLLSHTEGENIEIVHDHSESITLKFTLDGSATGTMSTLSYTQENTDDFITLQPENNNGDTMSITIMPSANITTEPRTAKITLITTGHEGTRASVSLTLTQAAAPKMVLTSHTDGENIEIVHDHSESIMIDFTLGGSASGWTNTIIYMPDTVNFITMGNLNDGTKPIIITPEVNTTTEPRAATITLNTTGHGGTPASVSLTFTQEASPKIDLASHTDGEIIAIAYDNNNDTHPIIIKFTLSGSATDWKSDIIYTSENTGFIDLSEQEEKEGTRVIKIIPSVNDTTVSRTAMITLITTGQLGTPDSVSLMITQEAAPTIMLTSPPERNTISIAHDDNIVSIPIEFTVGGSATGWESEISYMPDIPENTNFITLDTTMNDNQTGPITIMASPMKNAGVERTATITLRTTGQKGNPVSVSLKIAQEISPTIELTSYNEGSDDSFLELKSDGRDTIAIAYDATDSITINFTVGGSATDWESYVVYMPENDTSIMISQHEGTDGNITITPSANTSSAPRTATITLKTAGHEGTPDSVLLTVTQESIPTIELISNDSHTIIHDATASIPIEFTVGGSATGWESDITDNPFISLSLNKGTGQTGEKITIMVSPMKNTGVIDRTDTITLSTMGQTGTPARDTFTITQKAAPAIMLTDYADGENVNIAHDDTNPRTISFDLGGSATGWESEITYAPENDTSIMISQNEGTDGNITLTPSVNASTAPRTATITLRTTGPGQTPDSVSLMITQEAIPAIMLSSYNNGDSSLNPDGDNIDIAHDHTNPITIDFVLGGSAKGWKSSITYPIGTSEEDKFINSSLKREGTDPNIIIPIKDMMNTIPVSRTATITLSTTGQLGISDSVLLTITQESAPVLELTSDDISIDPNNTASIPIEFTVGGSATGWESDISYVPAKDTFITLSPKDSIDQTGPITIMASLMKNAGVERTATITLRTTGQKGNPVSVSLKITQEISPTIELTSYNEGSDDSFLELKSDGRDTIAIAYDATDSITINFTVGGSAAGWESYVVYMPENDTSIMISQHEGTDGNITITPSINTSAAPRTATITLKTAGHEGTPDSVLLTVTQEAIPTIELISNDSHTIIHDAAASIPIEFTLGGSATGWESDITDNPFISLSLNKGTGQTGEKITIMVSPMKNTGVIDRTDTITLSTMGQTGTPARDTFTITQKAAPAIMLTDYADGENVNIAHDDTNPRTISFALGGSATGWESEITGDPFINLSSEIGTNGNITLTPSVNTSTAPRTATITLRTTGPGQTPDSVSLMITQEAIPAIMLSSYNNGNSSLNPDGDNIDIAHDHTNSITIDFVLGGSAKGWKSSITYPIGTSEEDKFINSSLKKDGTDPNIIIPIKDMNTTPVSRTATITLSTTGHLDGGVSDSILLTITQEGAPVLELTSDNISRNPKDTASIPIEFTVGGSATGWESEITYAPAKDTFITLSPKDSIDQTGPITIMASPMENTDIKERTATITLRTTGQKGDPASVSLTITQTALPNAPTIEFISIDSISIDSISIAHDDTIPKDINFTVGGSAGGWESKITYMPDIPKNNDFIKLNPPQNDAKGSITIEATSSVNEDTIPRTATITLSTTGHDGDAVSVSLIITQEAKPVLELTSNDNDTIAHDAIDSIPIHFNVGGSARGWESEITYTPSDANFVTLSSEESMDQTGAITIMASPSANTDLRKRTATIILSTEGNGASVKDTLTITQAAAPEIKMTTSHTNGENIKIAHNDTEPIPLNFTLKGSASSYMRHINYTPENADFIIFDFLNSSGDTRDTQIIPSANTTTEPRTATIILKTRGHEGTPDSVSLMITQEAMPVIELISKETDTIIHDDTDSIPINFILGGSATGWMSDIIYTPRDVDFVTLSPKDSITQTGNITIMASPTENTDNEERIATITLSTTGQIGDSASAVFTIIQKAKPIIILSGNDNRGIEQDHTIPIVIRFTVGGSAQGWASHIDYMPDSANFITLNLQKNDNATGNITIRATPSANTSIERTATIILITAGHEGTPDSVSLTITQAAGAEPSLGVAPSKPFTLYPNPTNGTLTIEGVTGYLQMYIYDLVGREVMTYSLTPSKKAIDVSDLPSGMYVVTLQGEDKTWTEVLIIVN